MAPRTNSRSNTTADPREEARLDQQWWVKTKKADGTHKTTTQLHNERKQVLQAVRQLEAVLDRELLQCEIKKVAKLVEQEHTPNDILTCPGLLDLPEHHTKWGEVFGSSAANKANTAGVNHSTLNLTRGDPPPSSKNQGGRVDASTVDALNQIPGLKGKAPGFRVETEMYSLTTRILKHLRSFRTSSPASSIHAWADNQAIAQLGDSDDTLSTATKVKIDAKLLEWYSDAFMNSLYSVLTHRDSMDSAPLSRENVSPCSYTTRAQVAAMLNLVPPSMWNEEMNTATTNAHQEYLISNTHRGSEYDVHTKKYMLCRRMAVAFSPSGSAQTDICKWVIGQQSIIEPRLAGADKQLRKVERVQVPNKKSADEFRRILRERRPGPLSLSAWADVCCIMVSAPLASQNQYIYVDSSLLEFNSKAFLLAVVNSVHGHSSIRTRSDAIKFLIDTYALPLQHEAHRPPTAGQLSAYKRYLSSSQCKYSDQDVCMLLASIAPDKPSDTKSLVCTVTAERLDEYPLDFLWLAARSLGAVASHSAGRAKLYGVSKACVFEHEEQLAQAAYAHESASKYKPQLVKLLRARLSCASSSSSSSSAAAGGGCNSDAMMLELQNQSDVNLMNAFAAKFTSEGEKKAADGDVLQGIHDLPPKLAIRDAAVNELSDYLVHLLLCVLLDSADDADRQQPAERFREAFAYTRRFREGFLRNLHQHKPPTAPASCCLAAKRAAAAAAADAHLG